MSEELAEFVALAHRIVWCTLATVDANGRPRSRLVHPIWELTGDGLLGRVATATPTKRAHLAASPYASCSSWDAAHDVAVAECAAEGTPPPPPPGRTSPGTSRRWASTPPGCSRAGWRTRWPP